MRRQVLFLAGGDGGLYFTLPVPPQVLDVQEASSAAPLVMLMTRHCVGPSTPSSPIQCQDSSAN